MRQRNTHPHPLMITGDNPATVYPGDEIDHPHPLAGFEPVENENDEPESDSEPGPAGTGDDLEEVTE